MPFLILSHTNTQTHTHSHTYNHIQSILQSAPVCVRQGFLGPVIGEKSQPACFIPVQLLSGGLFTCSRVGSGKTKMWAEDIRASTFFIFFFLPSTAHFINVRPCLCIVPLVLAYSQTAPASRAVLFSYVFRLIGHMSVTVSPHALSVSHSVRYGLLQRAHLSGYLFRRVLINTCLSSSSFPVLWKHLQRPGSDGRVGLL